VSPLPLAGATVAAATGALLLFTGAGSGIPPGPPTAVFRTEIGIVVLQTTVTNDRGEVITGLDRSAFTVYENGKAQAITAFSRDDVPVSLGLALDHSRSMRLSRTRVEAAARALAGASNPRDEVFLMGFADKPAIEIPFTDDARALEEGIGRFAYIGGTALREAVVAGEVYLGQHARRQRKILVVISDGCDNSSEASREDVRERARRSRTVVHAIGLLHEDDPSKAHRGREELDALCSETGGLAYYPRATEDAAVIALDLARRIRSQYTIGYSPANQSLDGSYRRIRVVAKGPGRLSVRTRRGYRAVAGAPGTPGSGDSKR
jgi:Ca-activated chloride channel homolog